MIAVLAAGLPQTLRRQSPAPRLNIKGAFSL
jgi:hypothetical protein